MSTNRQIAATIFSQLGGERFKIMTGAHSFSAVEGGISFKLPRGKYFFVQLNGSDLYDLSLWRSGSFRKDKWIEPACKAKHSDIGVEQLQSTFTEMTGLYTTL